MIEQLNSMVVEWSTPVLLVGLAGTIAVLGKSADWLVDEAVALSERSKIPKVVIGATVVSLGTTAPEAAVSVLAALQGNPGLALGNAVGSIICDTGLILGLSSLVGRLPLDRQLVNRQGTIQILAGFLLVAACLPWSSLSTTFTDGGRLPQWVGFGFLVLLVVYIRKSIQWAKQQGTSSDGPTDESGSVGFHFFKLVGATLLVILSSQVLIVMASELAARFDIPESVIAATIVAFGTSLPELVTAISAVRRQHGELAIGNVIGADILNVLFVAGAAASATSGGLVAPANFFQSLFPAMLAILIVFRVGVYVSGDHLKRSIGLILLGIYAAIVALGFTS